MEARNHVLDPGMPIVLFEQTLAQFRDYVSLVKLGWGTALEFPSLAKKKVAVCRELDIPISPGGTLFEYFESRDERTEFRKFCLQMGFGTIEVSDGTIELPAAARQQAVYELRDTFSVLTEVGSKDANTVVAPSRWVSQVRQDLQDGADFVILESRESGTAGLFRPTGELRSGLIDEILTSDVCTDRLVFEAPTKAHQVAILQLVGLRANLGNIGFSDILAVATLRSGLRSDTLGLAGM